MTDASLVNDEIDINEAMQITGKSRATLMRWKREKGLTTRTDIREYRQRQRRLMFRRSEIEALTKDEAESAGQGAAVDTHALTG
jgi:predicted DNA-binding transcriptional regulator AlpA